MKAYLCQARNAYKRVMCYKANVFFRILRSAVVIFPQLFFWKAIYAGHDAVAGINLSQMLTYVVLSRFVRISTSVGGASDIESRMKTGSIGIDLLRPLSPRLLFVFQNLGASFADLLLDGLPVLLICVLALGGIEPPSSAINLICFIIALAGALIITVSMEILMGTFAFWFLNVWLLGWIMHFFDLVLSGGVVPLWFYPDWLRSIASALPFQAAKFLPVAIYLGEYSGVEIIRAFMTQAMWIVILISVQSFLWKKGIKRIVVFGG